MQTPSSHRSRSTTYHHRQQGEPPRYHLIRGKVHGINRPEGATTGYVPCTTSLNMIADISSGRAAYDRSQPEDLLLGPGRVLILSAIKGLRHAIEPYLVAAGADMNLVGIREPFELRSGRSHPLHIPDDIKDLVTDIRTYRVSLVIIDPLSAFLTPEIDVQDRNAVNRALAPLHELAEQTNAAIMIASDLVFSTSAKGAYTSTQTQAPEKKPTHTQHTGGNVSGSSIGSSTAANLVRTIASCDNKPDAATRRADAARALHAAILFLRQALAHGPRPGTILELEAKMQGIEARTLRRARERLGVWTSKERIMNGRWLWELPDVPVHDIEIEESDDRNRH